MIGEIVQALSRLPMDSGIATASNLFAPRRWRQVPKIDECQQDAARCQPQCWPLKIPTNMLASINIFSLHYFLWSGALSSIYSYVSVYAEHYANASSSQYGLLNMVLPFVTTVSNVLICSLADRHQAHRSLFLWFMFIALIGYGSYGILALVVTPQPKDRGLNLAAWIMICIITAVSTIAMGVITCLSDTFAVSSSIRNSVSYGQIRVWGTLGWGLGSLLLSFINQSHELPLLVPGLIMTVVLILADLLASSFWPHKNDFKLERPVGRALDQQNVATDSLKNPKTGASAEICHIELTKGGSSGSGQTELQVSSIKIQWKLFKEVARRRKSIFVYMTLFALSGAVISLQWSYFLLYLRGIHEADFAFISGFAMTIDSIIELPFFLLSGEMIRVLGRNNALSFSFLSIGVRFLLYKYLLPHSSIYCVIIPELLQGPSFGLFYVVMTEVANEYSECEDAILQVIKEGLVPNSEENVNKLRQSLRATMQSVVNSCYEGLGLGIGSIVGGLAIQHYGFDNLWFYSALVSLLVGVATGIFDGKFNAR